MIELEWLPTGWRQTLFLTSLMTFGIGITLVLNWNLGILIGFTVVGILAHSLMHFRQHQLLITECQLLRAELEFVHVQRVNSNGLLEEWTDAAIVQDENGQVQCQYCHSKHTLLAQFPFDPNLHLKSKQGPCSVPIARSYFERIEMCPPHILDEYSATKK